MWCFYWQTRGAQFRLGNNASYYPAKQHLLHALITPYLCGFSGNRAEDAYKQGDFTGCCEFTNQAFTGVWQIDDCDCDGSRRLGVR